MSKNDVLAILAKMLWFFNNSDTLANLRRTHIERVCACEFKELFKKSFVRTSYYLYLVFQSRSIEIKFRAKQQ